MQRSLEAESLRVKHTTAKAFQLVTKYRIKLREVEKVAEEREAQRARADHAGAEAEALKARLDETTAQMATERSDAAMERTEAARREAELQEKVHMNICIRIAHMRETEMQG